MSLRKNSVIAGILTVWMMAGCHKGYVKEKNDLSLLSFTTYCNPLDIDYTYSVVNTSKGISYRSGADPAVVQYGNDYYMFVTRSQGYWHSTDLGRWEFIHPERWYFESSNAPGAWSADSLLMVLANPFGYMSLITASNPTLGNWQAQPAIIPIELHDPALFVDDDHRVYLYEGSSNSYPIQGVELDPENYFLPIGKPVSLIRLHPGDHGWERFGEDHISDINPFIEGAWMTKHQGKYYLQYAAPGTQWNVYADGVYVSDYPLGPFTYASYNPISYKPGGFVQGAGHGSTVQDPNGAYWHFVTSRISVNYLMERRISMFPAGFDVDQMYVNTAYGDYPHFLPGHGSKEENEYFTGWMLLSYHKPVRASSVKPKEPLHRIDESRGGWMLPLKNITFDPQNVVDENMQSFWVAQTNNSGEWLQLDLLEADTVFAVQLNYMDVNSTIFGKVDGLFHQFILDYSVDGIKWSVAADYSMNKNDQPNAYVELKQPVLARYIRFRNVHVPTNNLALSGFRVFGRGPGSPPAPPNRPQVVRDKDRRNARVTWHSVPDAMGYSLYWGIKGKKSHHSVLIYQDTTYSLRALNVDQNYFYTVEAFNENGVSSRTVAKEKPGD